MGQTRQSGGSETAISSALPVSAMRVGRGLAGRCFAGSLVAGLTADADRAGRRQRRVTPVVTHQAMRWPPKTGQAAKRESSLGTAGWPEVRLVEYTEEA